MMPSKEQMIASTLRNEWAAADLTIKTFAARFQSNPRIALSEGSNVFLAVAKSEVLLSALNTLQLKGLEKAREYARKGIEEAGDVGGPTLHLLMASAMRIAYADLLKHLQLEV